MTTFATIVGDGTAVLSMEDSPNDTAPDPSRIFTTPAGDSPCYITTMGQSDNTMGEDYALITLWGRDSAFDRWFLIIDVTAVNDFMVGYANAYVVPRNMEIFAQLFSNSGTSGLTKFGIGYLNDTP